MTTTKHELCEFDDTIEGHFITDVYGNGNFCCF